MRIRIVMNVEIDPSVWADEYGLAGASGAVRTRDVVSDVRTYVLNHVQQAVTVGDPNATAEIGR